MVLFCENRKVCRNVRIAHFLDETPRPCDRNSSAVCDICASEKDCALYGKGSGWKTDNAFRLVQQLILDNVLEERE
ncbi:hypothetical protein DAPPUDRAFT_248537 [Daphnia pulex]|uniref:ATP-dependent DNA helicase RecQ zinc-binding domain-containing protein n=1 Tax=Daphnia pulex TaxID=6669 RepID=E9GUB7_DAPPU|nr:hypothetical protein DAPPUDRAFT_248537 [Daphnia pulex]|eukprot:EFX76878.1 hypothetical protein DAPPUDRAFT_248537 [Daphnia pulex]